LVGRITTYMYFIFILLLFPLVDQLEKRFYLYKIVL
jgi:hypothetical protein